MDRTTRKSRRLAAKRKQARRMSVGEALGLAHDHDNTAS